MAFPTLNVQQELNNRKILEDLQHKKQLILQKGVSPVVGIPVNPNIASSMPLLMQVNTQPAVGLPQSQQPQQPHEIIVNSQGSNLGRAAWVQASSSSFGYFVAQDSMFGNNILPVLPRPQPNTPNKIGKMACIKLKKLEEYLQSVDGFDEPKISLEQYITPSHIASVMLYTIQTKFADIENKLVGDLGCGCGMLSIGSFLLGATHTIGFDIDPDALEIFRANINEMELPGIDAVNCDVVTDLSSDSTKWRKQFDTVLMNPPFGTKHNAGIDTQFLLSGFNLARNAVYSLHKTSTRNYIQRKAKDLGVGSEVIATLRYNLDSTYKFHKKSSVDIEVDCWRFDVSKID